LKTVKQKKRYDIDGEKSNRRLSVANN